MTDEQRQQIEKLRHEGNGYATIAKAVGLSKDSIKAFCRTHDLAGVMAKSNARIILDQSFCLCCGQQIQQLSGRKKIKFCSAPCRQKWWNLHPDQVNRKAIYTFTCECCGRLFTAYGNEKRKYCCHSCYITSRFKGGVQND